MAGILITGAHGFIGRHLAKHLAAQGHMVSGLGHGIWPPLEASRWGVQSWLNGDIHAGNLRILQARNDPDVIFHLAGGSTVGAAIVNPREDFFRTVASTVELLEWIRLDAPRAKLIVISSAAVYGSMFRDPIPEDAFGIPYSPYGHHKHMMERLCRSYSDTYGLQYQVARLFSVYGPGLKKQLLWDLCTRLAGGEKPVVLGGTGKELRDWTYVDDVVRALELLAFHEIHGEWHAINIGTGMGTTVHEIAQRVIQTWHTLLPEAEIGALRFSGQSRPGDPFSLVANPTRLNSSGFTWNTPLEKGIVSFVNWFHSAFKK